jgi:hypothetical protein
VTGAGLAYLKPLTKLRTLNLRHCDVANADLAHLEGFEELRMLYLKGTKVDEDKIDEFKSKMNSLAVFFY